MDLKRALRIYPGECIAFCGSGGKTTAIFALAHQIGPPVLVTTTTHLGIEQLTLADRTISVDDISDNKKITISHLENEVLLLIGEQDESDRVSGVPEKYLEEVYQFTKHQGINLLIEADGSRQLPLKAPAQHEPVIPEFADSVVFVAGLSALGKPLTKEWVHRTDVYSELADLDKGEEITSDAIIQVLNNPLGGLKGIPKKARKICLLNQADDFQLQAHGNKIAGRLMPNYEAAIVSSFEYELENGNGEGSVVPPYQLPSKCNIFAVHEQIAAIILAAGGSARMGKVKQLLPWKGEALIRHVARTALEAGIKTVITVVGSSAKEIKAELGDMPVEVVDNSNWPNGQSSSVHAGLAVLSEGIGGVIFLLADQPQISPTLLRTLMEKHATTIAPIIAPLVDGQRGNPILFDRNTFRDLRTIRGDKGGRALFSQYPVDWIEWHDDSALLDIDTEEDYQRLLAIDDTIGNTS
jgi:molybdenum cofactor cytidylyltransferase